MHCSMATSSSPNGRYEKSLPPSLSFEALKALTPCAILVKCEGSTSTQRSEAGSSTKPRKTANRAADLHRK